MFSLQLSLTDAQAAALSHLVLQVPAHSLREWADRDDEADAMREALEAIRKALVEQGFRPT